MAATENACDYIDGPLASFTRQYGALKGQLDRAMTRRAELTLEAITVAQEGGNVVTATDELSQVIATIKRLNAEILCAIQQKALLSELSSQCHARNG